MSSTDLIWPALCESDHMESLSGMGPMATSRVTYVCIGSSNGEAISEAFPPCFQLNGRLQLLNQEANQNQNQPTEI